jgi:hypothetical protein
VSPGFTDVKTRFKVHGYLAPSVPEVPGASLDARAGCTDLAEDYDPQDIPRIGRG